MRRRSPAPGTTAGFVVFVSWFVGSPPVRLLLQQGLSQSDGLSRTTGSTGAGRTGRTMTQQGGRDSNPRPPVLESPLALPFRSIFVRNGRSENLSGIGPEDVIRSNPILCGVMCEYRVSSTSCFGREKHPRVATPLPSRSAGSNWPSGGISLEAIDSLRISSYQWRG